MHKVSDGTQLSPHPAFSVPPAWPCAHLTASEDTTSLYSSVSAPCSICKRCCCSSELIAAAFWLIEKPASSFSNTFSGSPCDRMSTSEVEVAHRGQSGRRSRNTYAS